MGKIINWYIEDEKPIFFYAPGDEQAYDNIDELFENNPELLLLFYKPLK